VKPGADCPLWREFLKRITDGNPELEGFLQRVAGYCLTGSTQEHALFFLYGTGANGKSVLLNTLSGIIGDYARSAPIETFTASSVERHPTDLASLRGARLVMAVETEEGRRWAESRIKVLTGGDKIAARFMRQDFFEFVPQFKLIIAGNHKPGLRSVNEAIRRRFHLVPFTVTIPRDQRDETLTERLKGEWPGILSWMISGCHDWREQGLAAPEIVLAATAAYLEAEDALTAWLEEACELDPSAWESSSALFASWKAWADRAGEHPGTMKRLVQNLEARGFVARRKMNGRGFEGLSIKKIDLSEAYWNG
jgi:putative DNA primase/helicase